jgi:hypothetical protein
MIYVNGQKRIVLTYAGDLLQLEFYSSQTDKAPYSTIRLRGKESNEVINKLRNSAAKG